MKQYCVYKNAKCAPTTVIQPTICKLPFMFSQKGMQTVKILLNT